MKAALILAMITMVMASCRSRTTAEENEIPDRTFAAIAPTHFTIEQEVGYKRLIISNPWQETEKRSFCYYLFPHEAPVPDSIPLKAVIRVPVRRMICMSTTHVAMLLELGKGDVIAGISGADLIYDRSVRDQIASGKIADVGYENNLDKELILSLKPDLLMAYGIEAASAEYLRKLRDMGVPSMYNADYLEKHPLARCEWIRVFGLLTGEEQAADSIYRSALYSYMGLVDSVSRFPKSYPGVLLGSPWEDVWYVPPADSYVARLITDAGGTYLFNDLDAQYAKPFSVEAVFERALKAEFWLNPGYANSLKEIEASDYRMAGLRVFRERNIYNNNKRSLPAGGNDYWERAIVHPDLLLRDIASILHPGFIPGYEPIYFKKLE